MNNDGDGGHEGGNLQWSRGNERGGEKAARRKGFSMSTGRKEGFGVFNLSKNTDVNNTMLTSVFQKPMLTTSS